MSAMYPSHGGGVSARRCQRCGSPLAPTEVYCDTCGQYNAPAPTGGSSGGPPPSGMAWRGPTPQTNYGGQFAGQQWGQTPAPSAPGSPYGGSSARQQPMYSGNAYYAPPASYQWDTMNGYRPAGFNQPPPQKRGPNVGLVVGIIILLIVLVASGGLLGFLYIANHHSSSTTTTTPTVAPTATPSGPPLFSDSFQNNSNGWDLTSMAGKFLVKVGGGSMILEDDDNKLLYELLPGNKTFSNFQLTVDSELSKGDQNNGYGVYIRGASNQNSDLATYYRFELYGDGTYAVFKGTVDANGNSNSSELVNYTLNSAIQKVGAVNHIAIIANGPNMSLTVNGQKLTTVVDNSYTGGSIALFVSNLPAPTPPGAQAIFNHLAVYPV
jgi:Domain of Unknown Function (DUF1080)